MKEVRVGCSSGAEVIAALVIVAIAMADMRESWGDSANNSIVSNSNGYELTLTTERVKKELFNLVHVILYYLNWELLCPAYYDLSWWC